MNNSTEVAKKSKMKLYVVVIAVALIIIIVGAAALYHPGSGGTPTQSSMAGTYVEQTSSGTGYTIILYENGTGSFSNYSGMWHIVNSTTFEGIYKILSITRDDYFTISNNGFTSVQTGNVYVKK